MLRCREAGALNENDKDARHMSAGEAVLAFLEDMVNLLSWHGGWVQSDWRQETRFTDCG